MFILCGCAKSISSDREGHLQESSEEQYDEMVSTSQEPTSTPRPTSTPIPTSTPSPTPTPSEFITPCGFTYCDIEVYLQTEYWDHVADDPYGYYDLPSGYHYLIIGAGFHNGTSDEFQVGEFNFQVYADNFLCDYVYIPSETSNRSASLSSGRNGTILLYYKVPTDAETVEIEFSPFYDANPVIITVGDD